MFKLSTYLGASLVLFAMSGTSLASPPLLSTGTCPTLTRYAPPTSDDWSQFPIKPTSAFITGCANTNATTKANCTLQSPITPAQSINCIQVPAGLRAELVGSELTPGPSPSLGYIMYFTFDERGRVWAAEPRDYPSPQVPDKSHGGKGRIVILTDDDGDGSLDGYKVFYTGLNMPTSVEVVNGGVVVTAYPYIFFIHRGVSNPDTAGAIDTLFSGMGSPTNTTWDTHGGSNSLTAGLDNWIYGHFGYHQGDNTACSVNGVTCPPGGVYRFRHTAFGSTSTSFQAWTTGPANAHGIGQMEDGQFFQSSATGTSHSNHSIRRGVASISTLNNSTSTGANTGTVNAYYPITGDRYVWDYSTAGPAGTASVTSGTSGHDFYTSRLLPAQYWNTRAFVCEGLSKLCNQDSLVPNGSTWRAVRLTGTGGVNASVTSNIFASTDAWVAPIKVRTGPDGGLWVLDWSNYLFLHNPASPSTNAAWNNTLRTKNSTRLYRIMPADGSKEPVLNLSNATTAQLVSTLYNHNFLWRMQAQRLLIAKGYSAELGDSLQSIMTNHKVVDAVGIDGPVIHAIWVLEGLDRLNQDSARWNPVLKGLLLHPAWTVRENVLKAMPRTAISAQIINDQCAADDPHAHVRLQAYVALAESPAAPSGAVQGHYSKTDSWATTAFNAAGATKLTAVTPDSVRPSSCPTFQAATAIKSIDTHEGRQAHNDLRMTMNRNGFELQSYGQLVSGDLMVYDLRGQVVFRSVYNAGKSEWSQRTAKGLNMPVYFYTFHGVNGDKFEGKIFLSQEF